MKEPLGTPLSFSARWYHGGNKQENKKTPRGRDEDLPGAGDEASVITERCNLIGQKRGPELGGGKSGTKTGEKDNNTLGESRYKGSTAEW